MTIGEKIKYIRKKRNLTQSALAADKITRNMLSAIESGKANPSIDTLRYLAKELKVSLPYFLSDEDDLFSYEKNELIGEIYDAFSGKNYKHVINLASRLSGADNEISFLLASSHFEKGKIEFSRGSMLSAVEDFKKALEYSEKTVHNTVYIETATPMYLAIAKNTQAPLLEFDSAEYIKSLTENFDYEIFKYITKDYEYNFTSSTLKYHLKAKKLINDRNITEAIQNLLAAAEYNLKDGYNAFVMFGIYTDLENCYKQIYDFENAYKYSSKRMSLLEGFKS